MKRLEEIAAELQGYDPQALSAAGVGDFLQRLVEPVQDTETVEIREAWGRVLAADLVSPISVPPHDNSAMDGYAFAGSQLRPDQALDLQVVGTALAGKAWQGTVQAGQCVKIMTGAIMPAGLDTVVPQEFTRAGGEGRVTIPAGAVRAGGGLGPRGRGLFGRLLDGLRTSSTTKVEAPLIAIGSGKGGTGKSFIATSMAVLLHRRGLRTTLVDCDFGLAADHLLLGVKPTVSLQQLLNGKATLEQVLAKYGHV